MTQLLLAPPPSHPTSSTTTTTKQTTAYSAPSAPGVHDTLRSSLAPSGSTQLSITSEPIPELQSSHPLESRLALWGTTKHTLHQQLARRQYGIAAPVLRDMELLGCRSGEFDRPSALGGIMGGTGGLHADILKGDDWDVGGWEGVYGGDWGLSGGDDLVGEWEMKRNMFGW